MRKKLKTSLVLILILLSLPGFGQEDDDKMLQELEAAQQRRSQSISKLTKSHERASQEDLEKLQELNDQGLDFATLMDENTMLLVKRMMEKSPLQKASPDEVRLVILNQTKGSAFGDFLSNSPTALNASVDIVRDPKALPSLIGLALKRDELSRYFAIWICLLILGWLSKKIFFKKSWGKGKLVGMNLAVSLSVTTLSVFIFYKLFQAELSPIFTILLKHYA